jgi:phosphomannomutase
MVINPSIFKAYDIRGVYPDEINREAVFAIGRAFVSFLRRKKKKNKKTKLQIVGGMDNRLSSPVLQKSVLEGMRDAGADVVDIGMTTTPMFYFAVAHYGFDGGIQISASHNPPEWNGLKLVGEGARPIGSKTGLREILQTVQKNGVAGEAKRGSITKKSVLRDYLNFNLRGFSSIPLHRILLVVDTANAVPGIVVARFLKRLQIPFVHINAELDGRFPSHPPDPLVAANLRQLKEEVKKRGFALGVAFDGDGDRIIFCDEFGREIPGDLITAYMAKILLRTHPHQKIGYDIRSSRITSEVILQNGGIPVMTRVGHSFVKEQMRKEHILFAGEFSGHFYHRDHYFSEVPLFVLREILGEMARTGNTLSQLIDPLRVYAHSGELNFRVRDKKGIIKRIERFFKKKGEMILRDGVRVDFPDWWFLIRASGTEPLLRLIVEAKTKKLMEERKRELIQFIQRGNGI